MPIARVWRYRASTFERRTYLRSFFQNGRVRIDSGRLSYSRLTNRVQSHNVTGGAPITLLGPQKCLQPSTRIQPHALHLPPGLRLGSAAPLARHSSHTPGSTMASLQRSQREARATNRAQADAHGGNSCRTWQAPQAPAEREAPAVVASTTMANG
jgi:hypothetical protein